MPNTRIFRKINTVETKLIENTFNTISADLSLILEDLKNLLYILINESINQKEYPSIYLITDEQQKLFNNSNITSRIYAAGLYFGFLKKGDFYFSIEGVAYLYKKGIFTGFNRVFLNESGEKSFLYGNIILKRMVRKSPNTLKEKDFLVIFNNFDEILGLGISRVDNETLSDLKPDDIFAINIKDKGQYLRKKQ